MRTKTKTNRKMVKTLDEKWNKCNSFFSFSFTFFSLRLSKKNVLSGFRFFLSPVHPPIHSFIHCRLSYVSCCSIGGVFVSSHFSFGMYLISSAINHQPATLLKKWNWTNYDSIYVCNKIDNGCSYHSASASSHMLRTLNRLVLASASKWNWGKRWNDNKKRWGKIEIITVI